MTGFDLLAEMRMREWLQRPAAERASSPPDVDPALPLEIQLLRDVVVLDHLATRATGEEATMLRRRADELMLRAVLILERDGRPLAVEHFVAQRHAARTAEPALLAPATPRADGGDGSR
jgi:hypothetical protein